MGSSLPVRPIRVLLVDDHRTILWGLQRLIESAEPRFSLVGTACSREEMFTLLAAAKPDVVVLDLDLGGDNAVAALPDLLRETSAQVLILTGNRDPGVHQQVMIAGARGVVLKDEGAEIVLAAIEKVHAGEIWLDRATLGRVLGALAGGGARAPRDPAAESIESLTQREREIIAALVEYKGAGNKVIADRLHMSEHTLRNHLSVIYRKLDVGGRIDLFVFAGQHGLAAHL